MPPARIIVTLAIVVALELLLWIVVALPRAHHLPLSRSPRTALTIVVVAVLLAAIGLLVVVLPAYWD